VNIRADEIVDGNPKLTLGLIWTLILHYQVSYQSCQPAGLSYLYSLSFRLSLLDQPRPNPTMPAQLIHSLQ